ncbi:MAG TPA: hypothetical protein VGD58_12525, partial [Herpetosiphonaceae bacterium]
RIGGTEASTGKPGWAMLLGIIFLLASVSIYAYQNNSRFRNWVSRVLEPEQSISISATSTSQGSVDRSSGAIPNGITPQQALYTYYDHVNNSRYTEAWDMLTDHYRNLHNPEGYARFKKYWEDQGRAVLMRSDDVTALHMMDRKIIEIDIEYPQQGSKATFRFAVIHDPTRGWILDEYCDMDNTPLCSESGM